MTHANMIVKTIGLLCACVAVTCALPQHEDSAAARTLDSNHVQTENDLLDSLHTDCLQRNTIACIKYKIYNLVDKTLTANGDVHVTNGLRIVKTGGGDETGAPRSLSTGDSIEALVLDRVRRFVGSHSIKFELKGADLTKAIVGAARSLSSYEEEEEEEEEVDDGLVEEGRGKKKKIKKVVKKLGPILPIIALKAAMLLKLAAAGVALLAGKALIVAKIALVLAVINGIGKLLGGGGGGGGHGGGGHQEVEVVAHHAHHDHEVYHDAGGHGGHGGGHGGHSGWGRSFDAQRMAYRGHEQAARR